MATNIQSLPGEVWKPVVGYEDRYSVSNMGRFRRTKPYRSTTVGRLLRGYCDKRGRIIVSLRQRGHLAHRLVLEAFVGPCPDGMVACHNDGNASNNELDNLRWDTQSANINDKNRHGTMRRGESHHNTTLTKDVVLAMRGLKQAGMSVACIARCAGVSYHSAWNAISGRTWGHV